MKKLFSLALLFALVVPSSSYAWGGITHKKVTSDAYFIMPKAFRVFLGETVENGKVKHPSLKALLEASTEPDRVLRDFKNHVFHIQGFDLGNGPFHVEELAKEIAEDIKNKAPRAKIIQKLGWVSHYIADLCQPLHTGVATWEGIEEKAYHSGYERDIDKRIYTYGVAFDGAQKSERISARMVYEALWANQYYTAVEQAYTSGKRYQEVNELTAKTYSRAVNSVVDVWYSIWAMSGGKINPAIDGKPKNFPPHKRHFLAPLRDFFE